MLLCKKKYINNKTNAIIKQKTLILNCSVFFKSYFMVIVFGFFFFFCHLYMFR